MPDQIFLSVGTPHVEEQERFLDRLTRSLRALKFKPVTLGRTNYDFLNPMQSIRELMLECCGAVIVGFERRYARTAVERRGSDREQIVRDLRTSTPWTHLEAGMAFQLGLPMLILKDRHVHAEGILDQSLSAYLVYEFDLVSEANAISPQLKATLKAWSDVARDRAATGSGVA
jgi:hypothetical protein